MNKTISAKEFRKGLAIGLAVMIILAGLEAVEHLIPKNAGAKGDYTPGTYTASSQGFGGPVDVTVTVGNKGGITDVAIAGAAETPDVGGAAGTDPGKTERGDRRSVRSDLHVECCHGGSSGCSCPGFRYGSGGGA